MSLSQDAGRWRVVRVGNCHDAQPRGERRPDSANGIRSALAAGLHVVAVPNPDYPPPAGVLAEAQIVLRSLAELTGELVEQLDEDGQTQE